MVKDLITERRRKPIVWKAPKLDTVDKIMLIILGGVTIALAIIWTK